MIRAVIDTNVLVSGMLSPKGNEALLLLAVSQGMLRPCLSDEILAEYAAVLARPKFAFPVDEIAALLAMLRERGDQSPPATASVEAADPGDTKFVTCAIAGAAEYIVTGNKRHFPDAPYGAALIVNAAELLDLTTLSL